MSEMPGREKWRPSLGLVIFAVLASVATLPLVGLFFFRLYDNQLIRQTQAELQWLPLAPRAPPRYRRIHRCPRWVQVFRVTRSSKRACRRGLSR
jgi:hypothetical protein